MKDVCATKNFYALLKLTKFLHPCIKIFFTLLMIYHRNRKKTNKSISNCKVVNITEKKKMLEQKNKQSTKAIKKETKCSKKGK